MRDWINSPQLTTPFYIQPVTSILKKRNSSSINLLNLDTISSILELSTSIIVLYFGNPLVPVSVFKHLPFFKPVATAPLSYPGCLPAVIRITCPQGRWLSALAFHGPGNMLLMTHRESETEPWSEFSILRPWPVGLSWLGVVPQSKRLLVWFQVRAHAWVAGLVPSWGAYKRQPPSLSPSLPFSLKRN